MALPDRMALAPDAASPEGIARRRAQAILIKDYETQRWPVGQASPIEVIQYLMEEHGLDADDMTPVLGTRSRVSEILRGRRPLTLAMLRRLKERFGVPIDAFIGAPDGRGSSAEADGDVAA